LRHLANQDGVTDQDVEHFKKSMLIKKSLEHVRMRAKEQHEIRNSPDRYRKIKSRVSMNMKVLKKSTRNTRSMRKMEIEGGNNQTERVSSLTKSFGGRKSEMGITFSNSKKDRENPFDITDDEMARIKRTKLTEKSASKLGKREEQIRNSEAHLQTIMKDLETAKQLHEKISMSAQKQHPKNKREQHHHFEQTKPIKSFSVSRK
jgi:hypothetical protein